PPLYDRLVLRVPKPWAPGSRLALEIRGVKNVTGVAGNAVGVVAVPEKTKADSSDSLKAGQPRDSLRGRQRLDSLKRQPRSGGINPGGTGVDSLKLKKKR
ncbi:MAG: hypothetical protein ABI703_06540, partial [Gemmatimonadales bacterium]